MKILQLFILSSTLVQSRRRGRDPCSLFESDSSWSNQRECVECCSPCKKKPRKPVCYDLPFPYGGRRCLSVLKQVDMALSNNDAADTAYVVETFKNIFNKISALLNESSADFAMKLEDSKDTLYKNVIDCMKSGVAEVLAETIEGVIRELEDIQDRAKDRLNDQTNAVTGIVQKLAALDPAAILQALQGLNSPFNSELGNVLRTAYDLNKQDLQRLRSCLKKELPAITAARIQKISECIAEAFKKYTNTVQHLLKNFVDFLKKSIEEILKSSEISLIANLIQLNRKISETVKIYLSICTDILSGRCYDNPVVPLYVPEVGPNPVIS